MLFVYGDESMDETKQPDSAQHILADRTLVWLAQREQKRARLLDARPEGQSQGPSPIFASSYSKACGESFSSRSRSPPSQRLDR
jgi:hypothetical protein